MPILSWYEYGSQERMTICIRSDYEESRGYQVGIWFLLKLCSATIPLWPRRFTCADSKLSKRVVILGLVSSQCRVENLITQNFSIKLYIYILKHSSRKIVNEVWSVEHYNQFVNVSIYFTPISVVFKVGFMKVQK